MRNVFITGFLTFLIVAAASFCISWYIQATEIQKNFEQAVARLNATEPYLTYDSIGTSGFPTTVDLVITNPKFSGRIDTLLKSSTPEAAPMAEWQQDIAINGTITFSVNAMSNHYSIATNGDWTQTATINGTTTSTLTKTEGSTMCSLTLDRSSWFSNLWSFNIFDAEHAEEFLKLVRAFDCNMYNSQTLDAKSNALLMSAGPTRIYFTRDPIGTQENIRIYIKATDSEVTTAGDTLINMYAHVVSPEYPFPLNFSLYGKQNIEVDFTYNGPADIGPSNNAPVEINLANFLISNNLYHSKGHFYFSNKNTANNKSTSLNTRFESVYTEQYEAMLKDMVRGFIAQAVASQDPELYAMKNIMESRSPEENYQLIEPIIPHLYSLGTIVQSFNGSYEGTADYMKGDYNLADFTFSTSLYGLAGNGTAKMTGNSLFPEANLTFKCTNCLQMVDDMLGYAGRVSGMIQAFSAEPPPFFITPRLIEGTKKFLYTLAKNPPEEKKQGNFTYVFTTSPKGGPAINGRGMADVMAMYQEYIGNEVKDTQGAIPPEGWKID